MPSNARIRPSERIDYDPIEGRRALQLPGGARVAVWLIVNIEEWSDSEPMPRTVLSPCGWRSALAGRTELGLARVRQPRRILADATGDRPARDPRGPRCQRLRDLRLPADYRGRSPAPVGVHGPRLHTEEHAEGARRAARYPAHPRRDHRRCGQAAPRLARPRSHRDLGDPDLLVEEGYAYVCDWVLDDQPTQLRTRTTPIVNVPYTQECNDVAMMLIQHHSAEEYRRRAADQFDQLLADARADDSARVMALVVHPYIMAAPHRLKYLDQALEYIRGHAEATFLTGEQIHDWYQGQTASE